jgi:ActR/RegA family two-component response regulator
MVAAPRPVLLVVEDDTRWQDILQRELGSEYVIKTAFSRVEAENALSVLQELGVSPVACVLDPSIPDVPPVLEDEAQYDVGERFVQQLQRHSVPFVILTGHPGTARVIRAFEELGASGFFEKGKWAERRLELVDRIGKLGAEAATVDGADRPGLGVPNGVGTEDSGAEDGLVGAIWTFFTALVGFPLIVFALLTVVVLLVPESLAVAVLGGGITLIALLIVSLAAFIKRITGDQFVDLVKAMMRRE